MTARSAAGEQPVARALAAPSRKPPRPVLDRTRLRYHAERWPVYSLSGRLGCDLYTLFPCRAFPAHRLAVASTSSEQTLLRIPKPKGYEGMGLGSCTPPRARLGSAEYTWDRRISNPSLKPTLDQSLTALNQSLCVCTASHSTASLQRNTGGCLTTTRHRGGATPGGSTPICPERSTT